MQTSSLSSNTTSNDKQKKTGSTRCLRSFSLPWSGAHKFPKLQHSRADYVIIARQPELFPLVSLAYGAEVQDFDVDTGAASVRPSRHNTICIYSNQSSPIHTPRDVSFVRIFHGKKNPPARFFECILRGIDRLLKIFDNFWFSDEQTTTIHKSLAESCSMSNDSKCQNKLHEICVNLQFIKLLCSLTKKTNLSLFSK